MQRRWLSRWMRLAQWHVRRATAYLYHALGHVCHPSRRAAVRTPRLSVRPMLEGLTSRELPGEALSPLLLLSSLQNLAPQPAAPVLPSTETALTSTALANADTASGTLPPLDNAAADPESVSAPSATDPSVWLFLQSLAANNESSAPTSAETPQTDNTDSGDTPLSVSSAPADDSALALMPTPVRQSTPPPSPPNANNDSGGGSLGGSSTGSSSAGGGGSGGGGGGGGNSGLPSLAQLNAATSAGLATPAPQTPPASIAGNASSSTNGVPPTPAASGNTAGVPGGPSSGVPSRVSGASGSSSSSVHKLPPLPHAAGATSAASNGHSATPPALAQAGGANLLPSLNHRSAGGVLGTGGPNLGVFGPASKGGSASFRNTVMAIPTGSKVEASLPKVTPAKPPTLPH